MNELSAKDKPHIQREETCNWIALYYLALCDHFVQLRKVSPTIIKIISRCTL